MIEAWVRNGKGAKEGVDGACRAFLDLEGETASWTLGVAQDKRGCLVLDQMLLELFEEVLRFGQGQPQLFDTLVVFL